MVLSALDILLTLPLTVIGLVQDLTQTHFVFWPGWDALHANFNQIPTASAEFWKSLGFWTQFSVKWDEWINPFIALVFFALFGLTEEARARYAAIFWAVAKPLGFKPKPKMRKERSNVVFASAMFGPTHTRSSTYVAYFLGCWWVVMINASPRSQETFSSETSSPFEIATIVEKQDRLDVENIVINTSGNFPEEQKDTKPEEEISESTTTSIHSTSS